jgi:large conductance mechanosensitive channel
MERRKNMLKDFKEFVMRGNVADMAVGIVIGAAFGAIVTSFVADVIMPPIGLLLGNVDFSGLFAVLKEGKVPGPYETLAAAKDAGAVTLNYGVFFNTIMSFLIVAFSVFLVIRNVNRLKKKEEAPAPATKECPFCLSVISVKAVRCAHCTSGLKV